MGHTICKHFLPSSRLPFPLLLVSFAIQKVLNLTRSHLFIFASISIILRGGSKKKNKLSDLSQKLLCLCFLLGVYSIRSY